MLYLTNCMVVDRAGYAEAAAAHDEYLKKLKVEDKLVTAGPKTGGDGEVIVFMTETKEEADALMKADPMVVNGSVVYMITAHVVSLGCTTPEFKELVNA